MANTDGSVVFGIEFDLGGIKKGMENAAQNIEKSFTKPVKEAASKANGDIENILSNTQKSMKAKAASIAAVYKKQGMDSSAAFKKAWEQIERQSETSASKVKKSINGIGGQSSKTASTMLGAFAKPLKKLATAVVGTFAVKKLVDFGKSCIDLGSDLEEVQNVVDVTFSNMSAKVDNFAKKAAGQFGLSETMAKKYTGTFGAMAKAFGFNEKAAYDMSTALTSLTGDVASFYNISQDEAYTKLKSVFTGETETLKDLGVVMTQNALDAYAMANGYGKTTSAMSEAEKVALRYAFVQDKLTTAAGDFARTSGSWANQVKILSLQFESFKATIGQGLINVFTPVIRVVNILIGRLLTLANAFKLFTGYFSGGGSSKTEKSTKKISNNAKQISKNFSSAQGAATRMGAAGSKAANKVGKAVEKASKKVRSLMGFDQINKLSDDSKSSPSGNSGGSGSGGAGSVSGIDGSSIAADDFDTGSVGDTETIGKLPKLYENLAKAIDRFKKACSGLGGVLSGGLKWGYENVLKPLGKWTISKLVPKGLDVFSGALRVVTEVCKALAPIGQKLWDVFFKPLAKFAGDAIIKFLDLLQKGLNGLADWIGKHQSLVGKITGVILTFFGAFKAAKFIDKAMKSIGLFSKVAKNTKLGGLVKAFLALPAPVKIAIGVLTAVVAVGVLVYKNWAKIKKTAFGKFITKIAKTFKDLYKQIKNNLHPIQDFKKAWEAIKDKKAQIETEVKEKVEGTIEKLKEGWETIQDKAATLVAEAKEKTSGIIDSLKEKWDSIKDSEAVKVLNALKDRLFDGIKEAWDTIKDTKAGKTLSALKDRLFDGVKEIWDAIKDGDVKKALSIIKDKFFGNVKDVWDSIKDTEVGKTISVIKDKFWNGVVSAWNSIKNEGVQKTLLMAAGKGWDEAKKAWNAVKNGTAIKTIAGKVHKNWDKLKKKWSSIKSRVAKLTAKISGYDAVQSIYKWWNNLKSKTIKLTAKTDKDGFGGGGKKFAKGGILVGNTWKKIQQYASGGTPNQGQMFVAREAGPELVGTLGGHTAVMNNDQIVASVSSGVAQAVSAAMGRVGQSLYNAVSNLKIESKLPQIKPVTPPPLALANTQSTTDDKKMIDLLTAISNENKANLELIRQFMALVAGLDLDVKLNGKSIKDDVVKRINNNTRATGKCEIIM